jgi:hypothetical protein
MVVANAPLGSLVECLAQVLVFLLLPERGVQKIMMEKVTFK